MRQLFSLISDFVYNAGLVIRISDSYKYRRIVLSMTSDKNTSSLSLNYPETGTPTNLDRKNLPTQVMSLLPTIVVTSNSVSSTPSNRSSTKNHVTINVRNFRNVFIHKEKSSIKDTMAVMSYRLNIRKLLQIRL